MIILGDELAHGSVLSAHLAVIGAGPAGIVIAVEAARHGFDVLLIESGYKKFDARTQRLSDAARWDPVRHAPRSVTITRQLGGTSAIWGGRCVPYDPVDYDVRPYISDTAWPVTYEELLPYFQRACDWLRCGRAVFDARHMTHLPPSLVPGLQDEDGSTATLERWSLPVNFAREYGGTLRRSGRVQVVTGLTCTEVICRPGGTRADRLACRTLTGKRISVYARCYALACGGLETTRLMLASRGPHGASLGDHSGHLGCWYMGHVDGVIAQARFLTPPRSTIFGYERDIDGTYIRRRFSVNRTAQLEHELPNAIAYVANPALADPRHRNGILSFAYLALRSPLGRLVASGEQQLSVMTQHVPGSYSGLDARPQIRAHLMNVSRDLTSVACFAAEFGRRRFLASGRRIPGFFAAYSAENLYPLHYHGEHIPDRDSRVRLSSERDELGMPKLEIDLRFSKHDVDGMLRCHQIWDNYLRKTNCGRLEYTSPDPASAAWEQLGGGCHQLGTTRMAAKSEDGVVDKHLAVHGISNLFVTSSSSFLTSSQANPTFMLTVFALRLADRLKSILPSM